jgi:hypothetical protein
MNLGELVTSHRVDSDDKVYPFFTKPDDVVRFLNEAEAVAAIRARLLFDDTQTITVTAGTSRYDFGGLFEITNAVAYRKTGEPSTYATTGGIHLIAKSRDWMDRNYPDWREDRRPPCFYIRDDVSITLPCIVDRDYIIRLEGYRTPKKLMNDSNDRPEINALHHRFLVHWSLHRAYAKPDSEIFNPDKSAKALKEFEDYFGYRPTVNERHREQADRDHHNMAYW